MPRRPVSKQRLTGESFMDRQYERAVTTGKAASLLESPSSMFNVYGLGGLVAILAIALAFMQGMVDPSPNTGMSEMIRTKDGGLYVAVAPDDPETGEPDEDAEKTLHEVRNLASARLIAGSPDEPTVVGSDDLAEYTRGRQMGIDGGPNNLDTYPSDRGSYWGICDWRDTRSNLSLTESQNLTTSVVAGDVWSGGDVLGRNDAILVRPSNEQTQLYIVFGDRKAKIDAGDSAMLGALGIGAGDVDRAQVVSPGTLNAIPASPDMLAPQLQGSGDVSEAVSGSNVGDVLRTESASGGTQFYAVLSDGVQEVPEVVADMLVNHGGTVGDVNGSEVAGHPRSSEINLEAFPTAAPTVHEPASMCMAWKRDSGANTPETRIVYGERLPIRNGANDQAVQTLPLAEGSRAVADRVVTAPGRGWFAQLTGDGEEGSDVSGQLMFVSDSGERFDLVGDGGEDMEGEAAREALGFTGEPVMIPNAVARMLPKGPDLSREAAMVETVGRSDDPPEAGQEADDDDDDQLATPREGRASQTQAPDSSEATPDQDEVDDLTEELIDEYGETEDPSESESETESPASREPDSPDEDEPEDSEDS